MAADLRIVDGNPVWASQAIVPSRDTVVSPASSPSVAAVAVNATGIYVYVKVDNIGTVDIGVCSCAATGAWAAPTLFANFFGNAAGSTSQTQSGVTFSASQSGDSLSGPGISHFFGVVASGRRAWAWSPDGRFFAYVASPNGTDWYLTVIALQNITKSNGTVVAKGQEALSGVNGLFNGLWNNGNFGWAGSKAVIASGVGAGGGTIARTVACPEAAPTNAYGETIPDSPGQIGWAHLASPCGSVVAFVPKILTTSAGSRNAYLISTATAKVVPFKSNNVATTVTISGANPSITTVTHTANGVRVNTGSTTQNVDDPDCTVVGGGVAAWVDRVKASTLPSANLGVVSVGSGVVGLIRTGQSAWVQVPQQNASGWANQGERHWCLLGQAYTSDGTTVAKPWNGQATSPPPFPVSRNNCAQRNIEITP
jgi:hypothetical protein